MRTLLAPDRISRHALLIVALAVVLVAGSSPAHATTFGGFEIDGDLDPNTDIPLGDDWENAPNLAFGIDELFGQDDDSFNNIKENTIPDNFDDRSGDPNVEVTTGGIPPNKSDFTRFYVANQNFVGDGDEYLYLAWQRTLDSGSATMDFELNQSNDMYPETGLPVRSTGDLLITYDFSGNGTLSVEFREWDGTKWGSSTDLGGAGFAAAAINTASVVDPISGASLSSNTFGELAINLTDSGIIPADECINFGSAHVKSRSSPSFSSSMKDFIAPIDISIGNCGFNIGKSANTDVSKVGDDVVYTFTVTNTGNPGSPTLLLDSISDDILGDLSAEAIAAGLDQLDFGEAQSFDVTYTVQLGDPDPLTNTVTATYADVGTFSQTDSANHELNLFQPAIAIDLSGDAFSKIGDTVNYTITVNNNSSADSPNLIGTVTDPYDGSTTPINLVSGGTYTETGAYTVLNTDPDPFSRTASVIASPDGFPNILTDSDDHSVNLFQPDFSITAGGDTLSKVGDEATYTFTITNLSSDDAPPLDLVSLGDTVLGDISGDAATAGLDALGTGESQSFDVTFTIPDDASDPLDNTVTAVYQVNGFPNQLTRMDDHSVNLFQPSITIEKDGPDSASVGDDVVYTIVITNTSSDDSPDLMNPTIADSLTGDLLDPNNSFVTSSDADGVLSVDEVWTIETTRTVELDDPDNLINTVTATFNPDGFPNVIGLGLEADHSLLVLHPELQIEKTPDGDFINPGDTATFTIVITNVGAGRAIDVVLEDTLPTPSPSGSLEPLVWGVSVDTDLYSNGDTFTYDVGNLDSGDSATVTVWADIPLDYLDAPGNPGGPGTLGSQFEIDGDLDQDGGDTIDWGSPPSGFVNQLDLPTGQSDNSFGRGSKENTNPPKLVTGSIPNNKSDLTNFLFNQEIVDGNVFLDLGWIRANTLGTANIDFELNQSGAISSNEITPVRTVGDILVSFDFASGGNVVDLSLREWDGSEWVNEIDLDAAGAAQGAVNDGFSVTNPLGDPDPLADKTFGEAVVNLTQVFGAECRSFASAFVKSRSSASFTSALKDFIVPIPVDINTCQTINLPNFAEAGASNFDSDPNTTVLDPVDDDGLIKVTNDPEVP